MPALPADLRLGPVELTVGDLTRSVNWYERVLGLVVLRHEDGRAELGSEDAAVLVLVEEPGARPPGRHAGLFHYALLHPSREELARALVRVAEAGAPLQGMSDHRTHEALYLADPDGNGIELAADRPREQWPPSLGYDAGPAPLDTGALLATVSGERPSPRVAPGLRVGHLHLHVGDVDEAVAFYGDVVGFDLMARLPTAAFVSAGGYHHHLGVNVWNGTGVGPPPPGTVGLRHWAIVADEATIGALREHGEEREDGLLVRDPWGSAMLWSAA